MNKSIKDVSDLELQKIIDNTNSLSGILRMIGLSETCPHSRRILKDRISKLDSSKYEENKLVKHPFSNIIPHKLNDDDYFCVGNKRRSGANIKIRLLKYKNWIDECFECGLHPIWNNRPISLHVDHINGDPFDNRLENLRFLCPNCHSQTGTFGSKNRK